MSHHVIDKAGFCNDDTIPSLGVPCENVLLHSVPHRI